MTPYQTAYAIRYTLQPIQQQVEGAVMQAASDIINEDVSTADHANRLAWANWATVNSSPAAMPHFGWAVAQNTTIQGSVATDPTGASVADADIQFVVNSTLPKVITDFVTNPPSGVKMPA